MKNCDTCIHFLHVDKIKEEDAYAGFCERFPPVYTGGDPEDGGSWNAPFVRETYGCGEHVEVVDPEKELPAV